MDVFEMTRLVLVGVVALVLVIWQGKDFQRE